MRLVRASVSATPPRGGAVARAARPLSLTIRTGRIRLDPQPRRQPHQTLTRVEAWLPAFHGGTSSGCSPPTKALTSPSGSARGVPFACEDQLMLDGVVVVAGELLSMIFGGLLAGSHRIHSRLTLVEGYADGLEVGVPVEGETVVSRGHIRIGGATLPGAALALDGWAVSEADLAVREGDDTRVLLVEFATGTAEWTVMAHRFREVRKWLRSKK